MIPYPWLATPWQQLSHRYQNGYGPQALILNGIAGLGKEWLAKRLAQFILCEQPDAIPCGHCRQCHLFETSSHPDFYILTSEGSHHVIKIEQIREIRDSLHQTPLVAKTQVVLLHPLEELTLKAANALLKTLEEPPGPVFFLLIAHRLTRIPATLLSRCQRYDISPPPSTVQASQPEDICLRLAYGAPLIAAELMKKNILIQRNRLLAILHHQITGDVSLSQIETVLKELDGKPWALLQTILQDMRKCHLNIAADKWIHRDAVPRIQQLAANVTSNRLQGQLDALLSVQKTEAMGIHFNPQMALEHIIFKEFL